MVVVRVISGRRDSAILWLHISLTQTNLENKFSASQLRMFVHLSRKLPAERTILRFETYEIVTHAWYLEVS